MHNGKRVRVHIETLFESKRIKTEAWEKTAELRRRLKGEERIFMLLDTYCQLIKEKINEIQNLCEI